MNLRCSRCEDGFVTVPDGTAVSTSTRITCRKCSHRAAWRRAQQEQESSPENGLQSAAVLLAGEDVEESGDEFGDTDD